MELWGTAENWQLLDLEFSARTPSEALRASSRALGAGLRRLLRASAPEQNLLVWQAILPAPHHPLVLGAGCAMFGGTPELAARAAVLGICTAPASAAIRLLGLDPYAVHAVLAELGSEIDDLSLASVPTGGFGVAGLPSNGAPALDLLADYHLTKEVRLFAS